ncbi:MAG: hypothetical protein IT383_15990 [Deltaproteobacteria bacterium]|nr:hypothetical protein [Deltaproteobacteria bacterium]
MNGPDDIRRALARLALVFAVLGFGSVALGIGLALLGVAGSAALLVGSGGAGGAVGLSAVCLVVGALLAVGGVPELFAWYGISRRTAWGRWLGIVLCTTMLAAFPIGTAFGGWGMWVLLSTAGLRAFALQRSWLGDGAALAVGWFFMPDNDDARSYRVDRRGRRRRRGRHGGAGCLLFLFLLVGVFAFATCGSCWSSFAGGVSSGASGVSTGSGWSPGGASSPGAPSGSWRVDQGSGMSLGAPAELGAHAGSFLRELGVLDAAARGGGTQPGAGSAPGGLMPGAGNVELVPGNVAPVPPIGAGPSPTETPPGNAQAPSTSQRGTGQLWIFEGADGSTHVVDDAALIPEDRRAKARPFK